MSKTRGNSTFWPPNINRIEVIRSSHVESTVEESANHDIIPTPIFEIDSDEGGLLQMDGAVVDVDDEIAVGPVRVFASADQEFEGERFEDV